MQSYEREEEQEQQQINDTKPALLSKSELQLLLGNVKFSKPFEYKMKNNIKRKIQTLTELELPLLIKNNFLVNSYYEIDDGDGIGQDLEAGPPTQSLSTNSALVRQRSRVQIPARLPYFVKRRENLAFLCFICRIWFLLQVIINIAF